jgi:type IV secretion system protein TrbE
VGGSYYDLSGDSGFCFQPLARIDDPLECSWAAEWLLDIIGRDGVDLTPERKGAVWQALVNLAHCPRPERTLTLLQRTVQDATVKQVLDNYILGGQYGALIDHDTDDLADTTWQCFELEQLMDAKSALVPVLTYLFHRLEQRLDGRPTLIVIDEAWRFLADSFFAAKIEDWLKTLRKKNAAVWFATQSLEDITDKSSIAPTLVQNCPTQVYLPNARALDPQVIGAYRAFGFNDRQIELVATAIPKRQYYYRSPIGNRLFDLPLHPAALAFCGSNTPADQQAMDRIIAEHGVGDFAERWLEHKGVSP